MRREFYNMRVFIFILSIFSLISVLSSCASKQNQLLFEKRDGIDSNIQKTIAANNNYQIKPQDILQIRNLQNMSYIVSTPVQSSSGGVASGGASTDGQTYQVEQDSTVALPVIGRIPVVGLTRMEATKKIEALYRKTLLRDPIIDLKIVNLKITILGEIKSQGNYPLVKDKTTLIEAIGEAGGLTDRANARTVQIIRNSQASPIITTIDLSDVKSLTNPATVLQSGDIVYITENKRAIRNDNFTNFTSLLQPALIVLNTMLIILTLSRR